MSCERQGPPAKEGCFCQSDTDMQEVMLLGTVFSGAVGTQAGAAQHAEHNLSPSSCIRIQRCDGQDKKAVVDRSYQDLSCYPRLLSAVRGPAPRLKRKAVPEPNRGRFVSEGNSGLNQPLMTPIRPKNWCCSSSNSNDTNSQPTVFMLP